VALDLAPEDADLIADRIRVEMHRSRRAEPPRWSASGLRTAVQSETEPPETKPLLALPALPSSPSEFALQVEAESREQTRKGSWPQVRRISGREVAIKASPDARWIVVTAGSPLDVRFETSLTIDEVVPWLE
jgi:HrpA-like RNA helicase